MSDLSEGSGPIQRRPPRSTDGGAPVSGALAIVLAVIAVVAGFLILNSISDGGDKQFGVADAASSGDAGTGAEVPDSTGPGTTAPALPQPTAAPPLVVEGATVIVANANGTGGSAASMSNALAAGPHFVMGDPVDASEATGVLTTSVIYYDTAQAGAQPVAESLARALGGGVTVLPLTGTPPTASGTMDGGAGVLLMLGTDKANKTLEELNPTGAVTVITNPSLTGTTTLAPAG